MRVFLTRHIICLSQLSENFFLKNMVKKDNKKQMCGESGRLKYHPLGFKIEYLLIVGFLSGLEA
jgi:hypothetical protein